MRLIPQPKSVAPPILDRARWVGIKFALHLLTAEVTKLKT